MFRKKIKQIQKVGTMEHVLQMKDDLIRTIENDPNNKYVLRVIGRFDTVEQAKTKKDQIIKEARLKDPKAFPGNIEE